MKKIIYFCSCSVESNLFLYLKTNFFMIPSFSVPQWVKRNLVRYEKIEDIPDEVFVRIREGLTDKKAENAYLTIGVIAYNEEKNILSCLSSLAEQQTPFPIRIVVTNNNSTDRTQELLDKCGALSVIEPKMGIGNARQAAMDLGMGKYYLCTDADCLYPPTWAEEFAKTLDQSGITVVYSVDSYIPTEKKSRVMLAI
jgi:cellulose synthase/poly-beta-1,6-N-acetylglucosamine synthase-like glycosyltransferase